MEFKRSAGTENIEENGFVKFGNRDWCLCLLISVFFIKTITLVFYSSFRFFSTKYTTPVSVYQALYMAGFPEYMRGFLLAKLFYTRFPPTLATQISSFLLSYFISQFISPFLIGCESLITCSQLMGSFLYPNLMQCQSLANFGNMNLTLCL